MYNLTSFCFAGTKIRINLVFSVSLIIIKFRYNARSDWLKECEYRARSDEGGPISVFASAF